MSYSIERVEKEFKAVCEKAGVKVNVPIIGNKRLNKTLGRVISISRDGVVENDRVEFSMKLLFTSADETIAEVIKHEAAHYIVNERTKERHGHDAVFKAVCAEIGTLNNKATTYVKRTVDDSQIYKYQVKCENCDKIIAHYHKKCKTLKNLSSCSCRACGGKSLTLIQNW